MDIQAQIEQVRQQLNEANQVGDVQRVGELEAQLNNLINQLNAVPEMVTTVAVVEETYFLDTLSYDGIDIKELFLFRSEEQSKTAYELLRKIIQNEIVAIKNQNQKKYEVIEKELRTTKAENNKIQEDYDALYEQFVEKRNEVSALQINLEDITHKRDAAAEQLKEANAEIERLNSQIDDLQKEKVLGARDAYKVVDVNEEYENYKKAKLEAENSLPAIYNVRPLDNKGSRFAANYAENDEYLEGYYMYLKGNYREVTSQEASTFRRTEEPQHTDADNIGNDMEETSELAPPTFHEEDGAIDGVVEGNEVVAVAGKTLEERVEALELAIFNQVTAAA